MTEKKSTTMHGVLVYPLQIGACALIFHRGQLIRTSTVVAIHYDAPEVMQFETLNTHYTPRRWRQTRRCRSWRPPKRGRVRF